MGINRKVFGYLIISLLLVFSVAAATSKVFVETNYRENNVLNISNLTGVDFLNITEGYKGTSKLATFDDLVAGNITVTSIIEVRNDAATTLNAGDAVYFTSYISGLSLQGVNYANNTDELKHSDCVVLDTISTGARGQCVVEGHVTGMDTSDFSFGNELYLDTGGNLTSTKPINAICIQKIAQVLRSHASLGVIWISGAGRCNDVPARFNIPGDINTSAGIYQAGNKVNDSLLNLGQFNNDVGFYSTIGDLPTAAVTDGATTTISTGDQIYDFTIALNYITNAVSDLVNYFTKSVIFGHFEKNITSANASIVSYIDAKNVSDYLNRDMGWTNNTNYPAACTAGSYITTLDDSVTCVIADTSLIDDFNWLDNLTYLLDNTTINRSISLDSYLQSYTETDPQVDSLTQGKICQADATPAIDCDLDKDNAGTCAAGDVCMGGHDHSETYFTESESNTNFVSRDTWTDIDSYPSACTSGTWISTLSDTPTCTSTPASFARTAGENVTGNWNHTIGNYTFAENGTICFGWTCPGQIYYNGSSLVIKVT